MYEQQALRRCERQRCFGPPVVETSNYEEPFGASSTSACPMREYLPDLSSITASTEDARTTVGRAVMVCLLNGIPHQLLLSPKPPRTFCPEAVAICESQQGSKTLKTP